MKKLTILNIISGDLWGGKEAQLVHHCRALKLANISNHIFLFNEGELSKKLTLEKFSFTISDENLTSVIGIIKNLIFTIKKINPQIIVSHGYKEAFVASLAHLSTKIPWVHYFHGAPEEFSKLSKIKINIYSALEKLLSELFAEKIISVSRSLIVDLGIENSKKIEVVYNACEIITPNENSGWENKRPYVAIIGRLVQVKQFDSAIKIWKIFSEKCISFPKLYIVGDGPEGLKLKELVFKLKLTEHIEFLGFRNDVSSIIQNAEAVLFTSKREGMPTTLLEAIALGTPIVSAPLPAIKEVLSIFPSYPAIISKTDNEKELFLAVQNILDKKTKPSEYIELFEKFFSIESLKNRLSEIYQNIASRRNIKHSTN